MTVSKSRFTLTILMLFTLCLPTTAQASNILSIDWKYKSTGRIRSAPAIAADGTIYINNGYDSEDAQLIALNSDGTEKWICTVEEGSDGGFQSPITIGPSGDIYFNNSGSKLYDVQNDGTKRWAQYVSSYPQGSPIIGTNETIYLVQDASMANGNKGFIYARNSDGSSKWSTMIDEMITSGITEGEDGTIYFGSSTKLNAYNPDGTLKWEFSTEIPIQMAPAIGDDGTLYFGTYKYDVKNTFYAVNADGTEKWHVDTNDGPFTAQPAIGEDGTIYAPGRYLYAFSSVGETKWKFAVYSGETGRAWAQAYGSPAIGDNGNIYLAVLNNILFVLNSDGEKIDMLLLEGDSGIGNTAPRMSSDGTLYISSEDSYLYAIKTNSTGPANSPWPMQGRNAMNSSNYWKSSSSSTETLSMSAIQLLLIN